MDAVVVLSSILLVPIAAGWILARYTSWSRMAVALVAGTPLPLVLIGVVLTGYERALATPPGRCGLKCGLDRSLTPSVIEAALVGMAIGVAVAFLTVTVVRRRRR